VQERKQSSVTTLRWLAHICHRVIQASREYEDLLSLASLGRNGEVYGMRMFPESEPPSWYECRAALEAIEIVLSALVEFIQQHGSRKSQEGSHNNGQSKYKVSMCRDLALRGSCPRATSCTFAHSDVELDKYRSKSRKLAARPPSLPINGSAEPKSDKALIVSANPVAVVKGFKQSKDVANNFNKNHEGAHRESEYGAKLVIVP
jgi:RING finger/CCCH-type zinc finger protein